MLNFTFLGSGIAFSMLVICAFSVFVFGCKSNVPMMENSEDRITLGSFGGFAGSFNEYTITPDGSLFQQKSHKGEVNRLSSLDKSIVEQLLVVLKDLSETSKGLNDPGNLTYFLRLHQSEKPNQEWVWGGGNVVPNNRIVEIYNMLVKMSRMQEQPLR